MPSYIEKTVAVNSGYEAVYWNIQRMEVSCDGKGKANTEVRLGGYKDKVAFDAGKDSVSPAFLSLDLSALPSYPKLVDEIIAEAIKSGVLAGGTAK
jgi:hypothetical protein